MEGISLPKFLLLNKMSFLVLLTIYPLYRQGEGLQRLPVQWMHLLVPVLENIWTLFFVVWGQNLTVQSAFFHAWFLGVFRKSNVFPERLVVSSFRKARRKPPPGTCLAQGADFLFVCWGEALSIDKTSKSRTRNRRLAFLFVQYEFSRFKFLKDLFINNVFFSQPKRICTSPYFCILKWRRDGVKDGRIIFMVTEKIKREEQNHGKMHDRKREFGERIEKNNLIFSKKFDCFMVQSAKNRMGMGVCELFCMCRKNRKKVLTSRG